MKRNNLIKTIISLSLVVLMVCSSSVHIFAAQIPEDTVSPRWTSIATMDVDMTFVGTQGTVNGVARKQSTAEVITGTLYLYKWNGTRYEYMDEVSGFKTVGTLAVSIDFVAEVGVQYKAVWEVIAYTNDHGEFDSMTYYLTCR